MSAVVCGKRASSIFEELQHESPRAPKRPRCGGSLVLPSPGVVAALRVRFPAMSLELIEKALEESENDLDSAMKCLDVYPAYESPNGMSTEFQVPDEDISDGNKVGAPVESVPGAEKLPSDGPEWVVLLVKEMASASSMDDAKARASTVLEVFEKSILSHIGGEALQSFQKENSVLKQQLEACIRENTILKRAVAIQHERQKGQEEYDQKNQELQQLKQLVAQYQEQVRNLEVNNYALTVHLRHAQQGSSIPGRFHP